MSFKILFYFPKNKNEYDNVGNLSLLYYSNSLQ